MSEKENNTNFSYFYKLEVKGIHCFKEKVELDMSDGKGKYVQWTIILGDNGTGKTTLLRALDRMQPEDEIINIYNPVKPPLFIYTQFEDEDILVRLSILYQNKISSIALETFGYNAFSEEESNIFLLSYGASRRMSKDQNISSNKDNRLKITSLFDDSIDLINAEEWLLQKELLAEKAEASVKRKFQKQLQQVKNLLIDILPDVQDIRIKPINEINSKLLIEAETDYGWVHLRSLSFGYQTLTALIVDIAAKMMGQYPNEDNPLEQPVIILIDEIDLHLHPKWQRTVLDKLSEHFPAAQFIATSHSPLIVQAAQDRGANIVVCRKEGDRVVIDNNPDEVKGWRVDQILVSDLFNTEGSRSHEVQQFIVEKNNILSKRALDNMDKQRLEYINLELEKFPSAAGKKDMEAEDIIKRAAQLLKK